LGYWFAGGNVSLGTWNHLSVIKDGAFYRLLLNGNQVAGPFDYSSHTLASNSIFTVGELQAGSEYFDGNIDEVRIWREALSNDFIQNNMNLQQTSIPSLPYQQKPVDEVDYHLLKA